MSQQQLQPWHVFSGVFLVFWLLMSYFDNIFITLVLCVGAGFATDNLNKFMKIPQGKKKSPQIIDECPDKPLPPEPPSSNSASEDEMEENNVILESIKPIKREPSPKPTPPPTPADAGEAFFKQKSQELMEEKDFQTSKNTFENVIEQDISEPVMEDNQNEADQIGNEEKIDQEQLKEIESQIEDEFERQKEEKVQEEEFVSHKFEQVESQEIVEEFVSKKEEIFESQQIEQIESFEQTENESEQFEQTENQSFENGNVVEEEIKKDETVMNEPIVVEEEIKTDEELNTAEETEPVVEEIKKDEVVMDETLNTAEIELQPEIPLEEKVDLLADFSHPQTEPEKVMDDLIPQQEINQSVENLLIEDKPVEPEIIEHVAKQSLEEHEEELANLLKEAQRDSPDQEIEQVVQREKDEGDPWVLDEEIPQAKGAGESLVHLDSEELANKDDISHCAVFGDDIEPDDLDLDDEEKQPIQKGGSTSSSSEGPEDEEPVMLEKSKSSSESSSSSEEAEKIDENDDDLSPTKQIPSINLMDDENEDTEVPKPEEAAAKVEEKLNEIKESSPAPTNLMD